MDLHSVRLQGKLLRKLQYKLVTTLYTEILFRQRDICLEQKECHSFRENFMRL